MDIIKTLLDVLNIKFDKAFGLDIGDRSAEIIELKKFLNFSVVTYGRTELPEGVVENGRILDQAVLAEKIKTLLKDVKPRKISTNKVILSLPESQVIVKCFEVDFKLKSKALTDVIIEKASLFMPINIDKTYWDFIEKPLPDKTKKSIIFFSVPRDIANASVKFCNSIDLEVIVLCIESLSLARAILKDSSKQSLIMDIGDQSTNLSFFDTSDRIDMSITVPVAGDKMTQVIKEKLNIENSEADALKVKFGFKEGSENNVRPLILPVAEDILKETKKAIDYYEQTFGQKLGGIYIIGHSALLPGMTEVIKSYLGKEVRIAASSYNIDLNALADKSNCFPLFANVIGLGMLGASGQFRDINLLKKMPAAEVNSVNKLSLFNMGYLSRTNTVRILLNNKIVLLVLIFLVGFIFTILFQQIKSYKLSDSPAISSAIIPVKSTPEPITTATRPAFVATSSPMTESSTSSVVAAGSSASSTIKYNISDNYIFSTDQNSGVYSEAVANLQARLIKEGYFNGIAGGFFGPATVQAVKDYQKAKGLAVTGQLDTATRSKLNGK